MFDVKRKKVIKEAKNSLYKTFHYVMNLSVNWNGLYRYNHASKHLNEKCILANTFRKTFIWYNRDF